MMKILVTGASGFIGLYVADYLNGLGHQVTGTCRKALPQPVSFTVRAGLDIEKTQGWASALSGQDCVVHCAALASGVTNDGVQAEERLTSVNVDGSLALARRAEQAGVNRFVFLSSVKVHGESTAPDKPFTEMDAPAPEDAYGRSKWQAEQALTEFGRHAAMDIVIVRLPLVYGPGVKGNFLALARLAKSGIPLPFKGVDNKRSMVFLGNAAHFVGCLLAEDPLRDRVFLIADTESPSIEDVIKVMRQGFGIPGRLFACPEPLLRLVAGAFGKKALVERLLGSLVVDTARARHQLGWQPPFAFREGVRLSIQNPREQ